MHITLILSFNKNCSFSHLSPPFFLLRLFLLSKNSYFWCQIILSISIWKHPGWKYHWLTTTSYARRVLGRHGQPSSGWRSSQGKGNLWAYGHGVQSRAKIQSLCLLWFEGLKSVWSPQHWLGGFLGFKVSAEKAKESYWMNFSPLPPVWIVGVYSRVAILRDACQPWLAHPHAAINNDLSILSDRFRILGTSP